MPRDHKRNTEGLNNNAKQRSTNAAEKVDTAIRTLVKNKERINFNSVSEKAGVSKSYLYQHHRERIESLRKQQEGLSSPKLQKQSMTESSKDVIIASKNKRIKELEEENKSLKGELKVLRGKVYDNETTL